MGMSIRTLFTVVLSPACCLLPVLGGIYLSLMKMKGGSVEYGWENMVVLMAEGMDVRWKIFIPGVRILSLGLFVPHSSLVRHFVMVL